MRWMSAMVNPLRINMENWFKRFRYVLIDILFRKG